MQLLSNIFSKVWEKKLKPKPENLYVQPFDWSRIKNERIAVVNLPDAFQGHPDYPCKFWDVGGIIRHVPFGFPVRKGFELMPLLNYALNKLEESEL